MRPSYEGVQEAGGKMFCGVGYDFFDIAGDVIHQPNLPTPLVLRNLCLGVKEISQKFGPDPPPEAIAEAIIRNFPQLARKVRFDRSATSPHFRKSIDGMHRLGRKIFVYMNPRAGMPFPDLQRRNEGLGLWRMGWDGTMTWAYINARGGQVVGSKADVWQEKVEQRMQCAMVYRATHGVLDTLHWEGFREGVDDVRYLTTLLRTLGKVVGRFGQGPLVSGTYAWLAKIDIANGDLDDIRRDMARRIMALLDLGY